MFVSPGTPTTIIPLLSRETLCFEQATAAIEKNNITILQEYISLNGTEKTDKKGNTLLHFAVEFPEITDFLLQQGANPVKMNHRNASPSFLAVAKGKIETVEKYLQYVHPDSIQSPNNDTVLGWILYNFHATKTHREIALLLVKKGACLVDESFSKNCYLKVCFLRKFFDLIKVFLENNPHHPILQRKRHATIHEAYLAKNNHDLMLFLWSNHANEQNCDGKTVLHLIYEATSDFHHETFTNQNKLDQMEAFIQYFDADPMIPDNRGITGMQLLDELRAQCAMSS